MRYKLYLDDLRYPDGCPEWRIARNYHDAVWMVKNYGIPYHISFDHDLGPSDDREFTGFDFAKWFGYHVLDNGLVLPDNFTYNVHSANPVGAANITGFMVSFLRDGYVD